MVLYLSCVSFFAPQGRKTTHNELNIKGKRKSYYFAGCHAASPHGTRQKKLIS